MEGEKCPSPIRGWKLFAYVELPIDHGRVSSQRNVRLNGLCDQIRSLSFVARILIRSEIGVRPPIEAALLNVRKIIRGDILPQSITLLHRSPQHVRSGIKSNCRWNA